MVNVPYKFKSSFGTVLIDVPQVNRTPHQKHAEKMIQILHVIVLHRTLLMHTSHHGTLLVQQEATRQHLILMRGFVNFATAIS